MEVTGLASRFHETAIWTHPRAAVTPNTNIRRLPEERPRILRMIVPWSEDERMTITDHRADEPTAQLFSQGKGGSK